MTTLIQLENRLGRTTQCLLMRNVVALYFLKRSNLLYITRCGLFFDKTYFFLQRKFEVEFNYSKRFSLIEHFFKRLENDFNFFFLIFFYLF